MKHRHDIKQHRRADEDIKVHAIETIHERQHGRIRTDRIPVHPHNMSIGKDGPRLLFHAFSAEPHWQNACPRTTEASMRGVMGFSAQMADDGVRSLVIRQCHATTRASERRSAVTAPESA